MRTGAVNVTVMKEKNFILHFQLGKEGTEWLKVLLYLKNGFVWFKKKRKLIVGEIRPVFQ